MNRRTTALLAGVSALTLALAACSSGKGAKNEPPASGGGSGGGGNVKSIKVVIAGYSPDETPKFWNELATKYKTQTGITANIQVISWDVIDQQVKTMAQTNSLPDVMNYDTFASFAKDGLLYSADEVLSPSTASDFIDAFNAGGTYNGKVYGFPILSSARALFYNKTLFQQAGIVPPPRRGTSSRPMPRSLPHSAAALSDTPSRSAPKRPRPNSRCGCSTAAVTGRPATSGRSTRRQNVDTLQFLKKLAVEDKVTQANPGKTNRTDGAFKLFESGKAGMVIGFSPLSSQLDKDKKVQYAIVPMPTKESGQTPSTLAVEDYLMGFKHTPATRTPSRSSSTSITRRTTSTPGSRPRASCRSRSGSAGDVVRPEAQDLSGHAAEREARAGHRSGMGHRRDRGQAGPRCGRCVERRSEEGSRPAATDRRVGRLTLADSVRARGTGHRPTARALSGFAVGRAAAS